MWLTLLDYSLDRVRFIGKEVKSTGRYHVTNYPHLTGTGSPPLPFLLAWNIVDSD